MDINSLCSPSDSSLLVNSPTSLALKRTRSQYQDDNSTPYPVRLPSFYELLSNSNSSADRRPQLLYPQAHSRSASVEPVSRLPSNQHQCSSTGTSSDATEYFRRVSAEGGPKCPLPQYQYDCDQIRGRIAQYLESGEMRITQFQRLLDINSNSYGRFMKHRGPDRGVDNQTYAAAHAFFVRRDLYGIEPPTIGGISAASPPIAKPGFVGVNNGKKRQRTSTISSITSQLTSGEVRASFSSSVAGTGNGASGPTDVSIIILPGLLTDSVPVHDSCDEIRRKIALHLDRAGVTQASFLRTLAAQFHTEQRKFQSKQLNTFRSYRGADKGNTSSIFYAAYVYFERLRIKEGGSKTRHRLEMEGAWPDGFETKSPGPSQKGLFTGPGEAWHVDELGRYVFSDGRTVMW